VFNSAWVETTNQKSAMKLEKLDGDLKNYKSNSIKESIRRGHNEIGDHYVNCGDLIEATKSYSKARDYCTSSSHVISMCLNIIKVCTLIYHMKFHYSGALFTYKINIYQLTFCKLCLVLIVLYSYNFWLFLLKNFTFKFDKKILLLFFAASVPYYVSNEINYY